MVEQLACLDSRAESKLSLLSEFQEFFKRRGEIEYEYARNLERLCERFEKKTKQRNIRYGFNGLWQSQWKQYSWNLMHARHLAK